MVFHLSSRQSEGLLRSLFALMKLDNDVPDPHHDLEAQGFFGPACLYGQVLKTRRNDRIIKVERRALHGAAWRFDDALNNSEDSSTLNTSFIERLNLTIRQSSAYLSRRTRVECN